MKKVLSFFLCAVILFTLACFRTSALDDTTVFYLDYGDVVISDEGISGYDIDGNLRDSFNLYGYTITQLNPSVPLDRSVTVTSGAHNIELLNVNIRRNQNLDYAVAVTKTASANITISGENHLHPGTYRAGLDIAYGATVVIDGEGVLYTESEMQAGIGGGNGKSNGNLTINSGTIYATGGIDGYSAGIGGGTSGTGGTITINGGYIVATGGYCAAGIGGGNTRPGGTITINGGIVTASGGTSGAGIGGGFVGNGGTITINGGSVKAVGGENAADIGNGEKCKTSFSGIKNSAGETVSLVTKEFADFDRLYFGGIYTLPIEQHHPDDNSFYFYTSLAATNPFGESSERFDTALICDNNLNPDLCDGFSSSGNILYYGEKAVDSFTPVLRGDADGNGSLDGRDAVIARCAEAGMIENALTLKITDKNKDGITDLTDAAILENLGLFI